LLPRRPPARSPARPPQAHLPDSVPFERELVSALLVAGYGGIVVCDDIYQNSEMVRWWRGLDILKYDVTYVGHGITGTGILDFGGRLEFEAVGASLGRLQLAVDRALSANPEL
jgi:hypothetical protein